MFESSLVLRLKVCGVWCVLCGGVCDVKELLVMSSDRCHL